MDLTRCDGCVSRGTPACVEACRAENAARFPVPEKPIKDYWPQKKHEDWSDKKGLTTTLTPYNWTFVQRVAVEHQGVEETVHIPRHCMHCDDPPCSKICPVGANTKEADGTVTIDPDICLGGAKCRDVCPWGIPQRQAGVGVYLNFDPAAGGGVMYKCDFCRARAGEGREPACAEACRAVRGSAQAVTVGPRNEIVARARSRAAEVGGHLYGLEENGGTSVVYVSRVPFATVDAALAGTKERFRLPRVQNRLYRDRLAAFSLLAAPVVGMVAGLAAAGKAFIRAQGSADGGSGTAQGED